MCKIMEDMKNEAAHKAEREKAIKSARAILALGKLSYEEIADSLELTVDEVKLWTRVSLPKRLLDECVAEQSSRELRLCARLWKI